jgi:ubiquinone/menaquinone biosynthesis C-methylase UbiE
MEENDKPSPHLFFDTITGYQKWAAVKAALDLKLFSAIAQAQDSGARVEQMASRCQASGRGIRILADYLSVHGFLMKEADRYKLTQDSALFLDQDSPAYVGRAAEFMRSSELLGAFEELSGAVRKGGAVYKKEGTIGPENPVWISFAETMGGLMVPAARGLAELLALDAEKPTKILDVAAGHGMWGISVAKLYPRVELVALDWASVLQVTRKHAAAAGVSNRFRDIPGSAFDVDLGSDYDVILIPNFLHHFSASECLQFLKKAHGALRAGGRVAIVDFIPNPDRISPPAAAGFSLVMLATTPEGDAYTFDEYARMLAEAGFQPPIAHALPASFNHALIAAR